MSTAATTRKPVIPGASPEIEVAAAVEPVAPATDAFPKADQPVPDSERLAVLEARVAYLLSTVRQLVKDVKALNPIGEATVAPKQVEHPYADALRMARESGRSVLSEQGWVTPKS